MGRGTPRAGLARPDRYYDAYLFDLDGTICLGEEALPGAVETFADLRRRGIPHGVVTNNPTRSPEDYRQRLAALGIDLDEHQVTTSLVAAVEWIAREGGVAYPIGETPLIEALAEAGVPLSNDPTRIDIVVASYDRTFTYAKLQTAFDALWRHRRARLVATNPDRYCPYPGGRGEPDCAAIVAAIEASASVRCERWFGKPDPALLHHALARIGAGRTGCLMVGDRLATDIAGAAAAGLDSALVLTGDSGVDDLDAAPARPTWVIEGIGEILPG